MTTNHIPERRRGLLPWFIVAWVVVPVAASVVWWWVGPREASDYVPLSHGRCAVRFLAAGVGEVSYTSDGPLAAFLRPRLPQSVVGILGDVLENQCVLGDRGLGLMYHVRSVEPGGAAAGEEQCFSRVELEESTGFTFVLDGGDGWGSGNGIQVEHLRAFPRRDPTLTFRLFETSSGPAGNGVGPLVMEKTIPNPGYRASFPTWVPEPLPATKVTGGMRVTLTSLRVNANSHDVSPVLKVASDDPSWREPAWQAEWADATGNEGQWLSPFEPAWKLRVSLRRRDDAEFSAHETWTVSDLAVPVGQTVTSVEQARVVDGIGIEVLYVAPVGEITEAGGGIMVSLPRVSHSGVSRRSTTSRIFRSPEAFIRVDVHSKPAEVDLAFIVRDQKGERLNKASWWGSGDAFVVPYDPRPDTKTVSLEVRVNRPREVEFLVAPPQEMRDAVTRAAAAGRR